MLVKSQKLACSLQSNLTSRAFSPREAYCEESMKSAPHLRESWFLVAILTADDVESLSRSFMMFKGRVCHYAQITRHRSQL